MCVVCLVEVFYWGFFCCFGFVCFSLQHVHVIQIAKAAAVSNTNSLGCNGHSRSSSLMSARVQT